MGLVDGFGRLLSGQNVFQPGDGAGRRQNQSNQQPNIGGPKYVPQVIIERIEYYERGNDMSINVHIKNCSSVEIFVDRASLMDRSADINFTLKPGEMREFTDIYKGPILNHDNYKYCDLDYRTIPGDTFRTHHSIDYESRGDGLYHVKDLSFIPPVRDINGNR